MVPETAKPTHSSSFDGDKHKALDQEVRDMMNAFTYRVSDLQKSGASHHQQQQGEEDEHGVRIITLAGTNTGATMRSELDDKPNYNPQGLASDDLQALETYVNGSFQAVNNSIMIEDSYNANDPGVHLHISDIFEHHAHRPDTKHCKEGKEKGKGGLQI